MVSEPKIERGHGVKAEVAMTLDNHNNLIIHFSEPVTSCLRYRNWNSGLQVECWSDGQWESESDDYGIPLLQLAQSEPGGSPVQSFVAMIPDDIRQAAERYVYCQTRLLYWLSVSLPARQLFASVPHLLWLLIARSHEQSWSDATVEAALLLPRGELFNMIQSGLGNAHLKWLQRVRLKLGDAAEYRALLQALTNVDVVKPLQALKEVSIHLVYAATRYPDLAKSRAFLSLNERPCERMTDITAFLGKYDRYLRDALNVARLLAIEDAAIALHRCRDFTAIKRLHDRWTDRLNQQRCIAAHGKTIFPEPPVAGNEQILPVCSVEDLQEEGRLMHHCVASYVDLVMTGRCFIYRMLEPQRATIEVRLRGEQVSIAQITLAYNRKPAENTLNAAYRWIEIASATR